MALDAAARGVEWEALLVEMQSLLHRIAMVQLSPSALGADMAAVVCGCANWREPYRPATFSLLPNAADWPQELPYARTGGWASVTLLRTGVSSA